jgi:hypothetical protein
MNLPTAYKLFIFSILIAFFSENLVAQTATVTINEDSKIPQLLELKKQLERTISFPMDIRSNYITEN